MTRQADNCYLCLFCLLPRAYIDLLANLSKYSYLCIVFLHNMWKSRSLEIPQRLNTLTVTLGPAAVHKVIIFLDTHLDLCKYFTFSLLPPYSNQKVILYFFLGNINMITKIFCTLLLLSPHKSDNTSWLIIIKHSYNVNIKVDSLFVCMILLLV